jgi:ribose/xylose/arabinose/galactoside ABC-type transport system permease subunit
MERNRLLRITLNNTSLILFVLIFIIFGSIAPRFLTGANIKNILFAASYMGILATGMTFVLLAGGIDLSVGSNMYISGVIAGLIINQLGAPIWLAFIIAMIVGAAFGFINAFFITRLKIVPFIVTLSTLIAARGAGLLITRSRSVDFPPEVNALAVTDIFGFIPLPIFVLILVVLIAHLVLTRTQFGRQIYALGNNEESAQKAGINTRRLQSSIYVISGVLAAVAGFVSLTQIGRVQPNFGEAYELDAIAASVLGGASLFGGVGSVFPGTVLGTLMIQMIQAGLVFANVDIYVQPIILAAIIFFAVFLDSVRSRQIARLERRHIMKLE